MSFLKYLTQRPCFALITLASWGLVAAGELLQEWYDLNPCPLCIFQRVLYLLLGLVAFFGLFFREGGRKITAYAVILVALGGFLTALYQTLMQLRPDLISECSYTDPGLIERFVNWLGEISINTPSLSALFLATGSCSSQEWVFLGLSIANWSMVCFFALGAFTAWVMRFARTASPKNF